jgi:CxxC motif-containing protein (DUF1111 family)
MLDGPRGYYGRFEKEENVLHLLDIEPQFLRVPARRPVKIRELLQ